MPDNKYCINYFSKSDGKKVKRPYDPHAEKQHEFIAKGSGKLCKRYWDESKEGLRTANAPWTIAPEK
jgi:D-lyxose ketol-isomerase